MSGFYGADVEQLRDLGRQLTAQSEQLEQLLGRLTTRVDSVTWSGPDAERFRAEWRDQHAGNLRGVAGALRDAAGAAAENARRQEETSGGSGGGLWGGPFSIMPAPALPRDFTLPWAIKPGDGGWSDVGRPRFDDLFFQTANGVFETEIGSSTLTVEEVGWFVPGVSTAIDVVDIADRLHQGEVPIHEMVDVGAGALRETKIPIAYGVGVAVGTWNTAIQEFGKADFSQAGRDTTFGYIASNPGEAAAAAGEAIVDFIPSLVKNFKFW